MGASLSHLHIPAPNTTDAETDRKGFCDKMEDAFAAFPDLDGTKSTSFFGVYDGHGGAEVAIYCARQFHTELVNQSVYGDNPANAMLLRMDELIYQSVEWRELVNPGCKGFCIPCPKTDGCANVWLSDQVYASTGSAANVTLIRDNEIIIQHVAYSHCVLSRGGIIEEIELSTLHKPSSLHNRERIQRTGGLNTIQGVSWVHLHKELLSSRSIGASTFKQNKNLPREEQMVICNPGIRTVDITGDAEFLTIASNGMWVKSAIESLLSKRAERKAPVLSVINDGHGMNYADMMRTMSCQDYRKFGIDNKNGAMKLGKDAIVLTQTAASQPMSSQSNSTDKKKDDEKDRRYFRRPEKTACWQAAALVSGRDPDRWRTDCAGNIVLHALNGCSGPLCYHYDHIKPWSKGGPSNAHNCQVLQAYANVMKSDKQLTKEELQLLSLDESFTEEELDAIEKGVYGNITRPGNYYQCKTKGEKEKLLNQYAAVDAVAKADLDIDKSSFRRSLMFLARKLKLK